MKVIFQKSFIRTALFLSPLLFFECKSFNILEEKVLLTGKINDYQGQELKIGNSKIEVTSEGLFSHSIGFNAASFLNATLGNLNFEIFFTSGDSLYLEITRSNITFSGKGSETNSFLQKHKKIAAENENFLDDNHKELFSSGPDIFSLRIDSLENVEKRLLENFLLRTQNEIHDKFINRLNTDITYRNKRYKLWYPNNFHRYADHKEMAKVSANYYDELIKDSFNNPAFLQSSQYIKCVNVYFDILAVGEYKFHNMEPAPTTRINNRYDVISNIDGHQDIIEFFIKDHFNSNIWTYRVEALTYSFNKAEKDVKDQDIKQEISQVYQVGFDRRKQAHEIKKYREIDGVELGAHIFYPEGTSDRDRSARLFFHGGGWAIGMPEWSYSACENAVRDGVVAISFDYRLRNVHGTNIKASVSDALSAIAWVRENAVDLGINPEKILVDGFSAGGHLALMVSMIDKPEDFGVTSKVSTKPNAVIIWSTPYDVTSRDVYDVDYDPKTISPLFMSNKSIPPILAFHGEADDMVDFAEFQSFVKKMNAEKNNFTYQSFPNAGHFYNGGTAEDSEKRSRMVREFLMKHGFVEE